MLVCHCHSVNDAEIAAAVRAGACGADEIGEACGAGTSCGGCTRMVERLLELHGTPEPLVA
jgi:bacterioferritin-associated ferredoxin